MPLATMVEGVRAAMRIAVGHRGADTPLSEGQIA
jgi:hypothetical protein